MTPFQNWLLKFFLSTKFVTPFMTSKYGWPICETVHFFGLSLLVGTIGMFDLRLLGFGKKIPISALHKLIPWGLSGFFLSLVTGIMFLMTEPDQYIYNVAFQWKILFMLVAGLNAGMFYLALFRRVRVLESGEDAQLTAKFIAAASLCLWTGVIIFGRMLTFYRPGPCPPGVTEFISACLP